MLPKKKSQSKGATPSGDLSKPSHPTRRSKRLLATVNKASIASKLPFDVLFQIFEDYAFTETIAFPLETILLVCRSWNQAALSHPRLWSSFTIQCGDLWYWALCIPRRLSHCPPDSLLDIELDMAGNITFNEKRSRSNEFDFKLYQKIVLSLLTGPHGELACRWRTLRVVEPRDPFHDPEVSALAGFLVYPTPKLQVVELQGLISSFPILPFTPSLGVFSAFNVSIPALPSLSSAVKVYIETECDCSQALAMAVNLETLHLFSFDPIEYRLSAAYPRLTCLRLPHSLNKESLNGFFAPALKGLIVDFTRACEYFDLVSCKGIPWHQLEEVLIEQVGGDILDTGIAEYCDGLRVFLRAIKNIKVLLLHDAVPNAPVLKLLTTDCESLYQDHTVLLSAGEYEIELGRGSDRLTTVNELRQCVGGIADGTWEDIYARLSFLAGVGMLFNS